MLNANVECQVRIKCQTKSIYSTVVMSIKVSSQPLLEGNGDSDKLWEDGSVVEGWQ